MLTIKEYGSPCGDLLIGDCDGSICMCDWLAGNNHDAVYVRMLGRLKVRPTAGSTPMIERAVRELDEYFSWRRTEFDLPVMLVGTEFQKTVWEALAGIPYGVTESYGALAVRIGRPSSVRAAANAVGANPMSIIVPCHRVIGSDGSLTGYAGGLAAKRRLLALEKDISSQNLRQK